MKIGIGINKYSMQERQIQNPLGAKKDKTAESFQKQISNIKEQISKLSEDNEMPLKEKLEKQKEYTQQIEDLKKQYMEYKMEKQKAAVAEQREKLKQENEKYAPETKDEYKKLNDSMNALISAGSSMSQAKAYHHIKTKMSGRAHDLKGTIAAVESQGGSAAELKAELKEMEDKINKVSADLIKKYGEASDTMKLVLSKDVNAKDKEEKKNGNEKDSASKKVNQPEEKQNR